MTTKAHDYCLSEIQITRVQKKQKQETSEAKETKEFALNALYNELRESWNTKGLCVFGAPATTGPSEKRVFAVPRIKTTTQKISLAAFEEALSRVRVDEEGVSTASNQQHGDDNDDDSLADRLAHELVSCMRTEEVCAVAVTHVVPKKWTHLPVIDLPSDLVADVQEVAKADATIRAVNKRYNEEKRMFVQRKKLTQEDVKKIVQDSNKPIKLSIEKDKTRCTLTYKKITKKKVFTTKDFKDLLRNVANAFFEQENITSTSVQLDMINQKNKSLFDTVRSQLESELKRVSDTVEENVQLKVIADK